LVLEQQPRDLRPKNAYNLIRLLDLAIRWLGGEPPDVRVSDSLRPTLLAIKHGEVPTPDVMALARELTPKLETARQASALPKHGDVARADRALRDARQEAARRSVEGLPGPWGTKVIAEHPVLMRLKELETMKEIAEKIDELKLVVGADTLHKLLPQADGKIDR
jgi:hypothetical protein